MSHKTMQGNKKKLKRQQNDAIFVSIFEAGIFRPLIETELATKLDNANCSIRRTQSCLLLLKTKRHVIFGAVSAAIFEVVLRSFAAAKLDTKPVNVKVATKQRAIFVVTSLAIFEADFRLFVKAELDTK